MEQKMETTGILYIGFYQRFQGSLKDHADKLPLFLLIGGLAGVWFGNVTKSCPYMSLKSRRKRSVVKGLGHEL